MCGSFCQRTKEHSQQRNRAQRRQGQRHWNSEPAAKDGGSTAGSWWPTGEPAKTRQGFPTDSEP